MSRNQSGQALLIAIMLLATALTIVLSVTFTSTTETQITKLEEEHQKALAAAEAAIEAALRQGSGTVTLNSGDLQGFTGFTGDATVDTTYNKSTFVSPLLQQDEQYSFYLADYNSSTNAFTTPYENNLTVYYDSESSGCSNMALELTLVYDTPDYKVKRFVADVGNKLGAGAIGSSTSINIDGQSFSCSLDVSNTSYSNAKLLIVRSLFYGTRLGFKGPDATSLKPQGKFITSTARSQVGATTQVQLFQSFPQIPAEFFVTSF